MTENKKLKRKLIVQSFLPLSILIVIKSVTKETLGKYIVCWIAYYINAISLRRFKRQD